MYIKNKASDLFSILYLPLRAAALRASAAIPLTAIRAAAPFTASPVPNNEGTWAPHGDWLMIQGEFGV